MRAIRLGLAAALAAGALLLPAVPSGAHEGAEIQAVIGELLLPTRFYADPTVPFPGLGRRLYNISQEMNGVAAFVFNVDPATLGGHFVLESTGDLTGQADLGVYFYTEMADAALGLAQTSAEYDEEGPGGEAGAIPAEASKVLIFMGTGLDAFFTYRGFAPDEVHITAEGYDHDITIQAGQTLVWVNDDAAGHSVTSDTVIDEDSDTRLFDSSPKLTQPLVEGATFRFQFFDAGTYTYFDRFSEATGTVTVVGEFGFPSG